MKNGYKIKIHSPNDMTSIWESWVRQDYPVSGGENVIIDAGANIGAFSLFAACKAPKATIFSIEPVEGTFTNLCHNVDINTFAHKIKTLHYGVADKIGQQEIFVCPVGTYSSSYHKVSGETETINVKSLEAILQDIGEPDVIDLLKLDCEGAEMYALLGANFDTLTRFERIVMEYHEFSNLEICDVTNHLLRAGFRKLKHRSDSKIHGLVSYVKIK
jgi:FkbM family methyltransferase